MREIAAAACALLIAACTTHNPPKPLGPPVFPDFTTYITDNAADYGIDYPNPGRPEPLHVIHFIGPGGLACGFMQGAYCYGTRLPGVAVNAPEFVWSNDGTGFKPHPGGFSVDTVKRITARYETPRPRDGKALEPGHSVTIAATTCGVDHAGGLACINPNQGAFMLTPDWAGWLRTVTPGHVITEPGLTCDHDHDTTTCRQGAHGFSFTTTPGSYREF